MTHTQAVYHHLKNLIGTFAALVIQNKFFHKDRENSPWNIQIHCIRCIVGLWYGFLGQPIPRQAKT